MLHQKILCMILIIFLLASCQSENKKSTHGTRDNTPVVLQPIAAKEITIGNASIQFDLSNAQQGYTIVTYTGTHSHVKIRIKNPNDEQYYTYDVYDGENVFPLTGGNGRYTFIAYENITDTKYSQLFYEEYDITIEYDYSPYLYPNQYINFTSASKAVTVAQKLAAGADDDLDVVSQVYHYVIDDLSYDDDKSKLVKEGKLTGYLPDIDVIMKSKKGICFDYVAVMASMLRTQQIPARMEIGYITLDDETVYHAWISVYCQDIGWIDDLIHFDGESWSMMDPTLISNSNNSSAIRDQIKDKDNYVTKYLY